MKEIVYSRNQRGFTLLEIVVVVFIVGLIATIITLRFRTPTYEATPQAQANQILSFMQIVQEQAIIQPAILGIKFMGQEYQVFQLVSDNNQKKWFSLSSKNKFWKAKKIPSSLIIHLNTQEHSDAFSPNIIFLPSGELTPFELQLKEKGDERAYIIRGDESGNLTIGVS